MPVRKTASPVESLVRPQLWLNVLLAVMGVSLSGGAVWLGWRVDALRPALSASLGLEHGLLGRALVTLHFLFASQLAFVILWYRIRSRKDFRGQYNLWRWVGPTWLLFAVASAIDGRLLIRELVLPQISGRIWHIETLCWMAPAAVLVLTTTRFLLYDMRGDRQGVACVVMSGLGAATAAFLVLAGPLLRIDAGILLIAQQVSVNVWSLGALLSMLFHARYVIHVTNEAPRPEKQGRLAAILRRLWSFAPRLPRLRRSASKGDTAKEKPRQTERDVPRKPSRLPADNQDLSVDERESSAKVAPRKKPRRRTDAAVVKPPKPAPAEAEQATPPTTDAVRKQAPVSSTTTADQPAEGDCPEPGSGLSKKERRRLRKQQRQRQRARQAQL